MQLSRAASYAIHAVVYMASDKSKGPVASHHIAKAEHIPERFLLKVLRPLVSARLLLSLRGPNGGYQLARPAKDITLLDVVEAVGGPIRGEVPFGAPGDLERRLLVPCNEVADMARTKLRRVRIADLAGNGNGKRKN
jgi:Rrf2 family protein